MLIVDKREDAQTLRNLGASNQLIERIFMFEGWLIAAYGALAGIVIGVVLCLIQHHFGIISLGNNFIVEAYPVYFPHSSGGWCPLGHWACEVHEQAPDATLVAL